MRQYNTVSSSELKNLSLLMVELLCLSDPLQVKDRLCVNVFIIIIVVIITLFLNLNFPIFRTTV